MLGVFGMFAPHYNFALSRQFAICVGLRFGGSLPVSVARPFV